MSTSTSSFYVWLALQWCNWALLSGKHAPELAGKGQAADCSYANGPDCCFEQRILHSSQLLAWASAAQLCTPTSDLPSSHATPPTCRPSDVLIAAKAELHHVAGLSLYSTVRTVQPYPPSALYLRASVRGHAAFQGNAAAAAACRQTQQCALPVAVMAFAPFGTIDLAGTHWHRRASLA